MPSSLFSDINDSLRERVANSGKVHDKYRAVFISWEPDHHAVDTGADAKEFASLLERSYGFKSKTVTIPLRHSFESIKNKLITVINSENSPLCLWLIHYTGLATVERGRLFWTRNPFSKECQLDFFVLLEAITVTTFDMILLTDCDYGVIPEVPDNLLAESEMATSALKNMAASSRVVEALFAPLASPENSPSFTKELCRVLQDLQGTRVNILGLRSKLVAVSRDGKSYAPYYAKLLPSGQSNLLEKVGTTVDLRVALRQPLDDKKLGELKEWAQRKPPQIKRLILAECDKDVSWIGPAKERPLPISEFTLSVSTASLDLLDDADWHKWIGSAPSSIDTPRYNVQSPFISGRLSKSAGDEEVENQLKALVRRRNHEESWRNQDSRFGHYNRVIVLPLIWEVTGFDPALRVREDLELLAKTFKDDFGYTVEDVFQIPVGGDPTGQDALGTKIRDLVDQRRGPNVLGAGDLLIVIYTGHGSNTVHSTGRAVWSSGAIPNSGHPVQRETVDWSFVSENYLDTAECDVAQILDCCHAASAAKAPEDKGRNEILAACVRESRTTAGPNCFSRIVAAKVKKLAREGEPFSFRELAEAVEQETRKMNRSGTTAGTIPSPYYKQISHHMSSIMLRPRSANAFGGTQRPMTVPDAIDRKVVAKVFVVLSLNSRLEEVRREHVTQNELRERLQSGRL